MQFTPDLLPSDVVGVTVWNRGTSEFEFRPGPIFANIVLGDEINRASPKTQSALLEAMAERQVTVDGTTYPLEPPFMVIATQNPIEHEGTYPLPESQLDRFLHAGRRSGTPIASAELEILDAHGDHSTLEDMQPVATAADVRAMTNAARPSTSHPASRATSSTWPTPAAAIPRLALGMSPRATLSLQRVARARWPLRTGGTTSCPTT